MTGVNHGLISEYRAVRPSSRHYIPVEPNRSVSLVERKQRLLTVIVTPQNQSLTKGIARLSRGTDMPLIPTDGEGTR